MGYLKQIRDGIALANKLTSELQPKVSFEKYESSSGTGKKIYAGVVQLPALVDWKQKQVRTLTGTLTVSRAYIMFLDIQALMKATDGEGIDDNDKITLPDGTTGPILDMSGFIDAGTGRPFATEVWLG